nr:immunoglobulin light chain junction region [Macaca mulatta]
CCSYAGGYTFIV